MAKVTITLEDMEDGSVEFNTDLPVLGSEEDVTRAILVAIQMITTASKMFVNESEFDDEG